MKLKGKVYDLIITLISHKYKINNNIYIYIYKDISTTVIITKATVIKLMIK